MCVHELSVPRDWQIVNILNLQRTEGTIDLTVFPGLQATHFQNQKCCPMPALPGCRLRIPLNLFHRAFLNVGVGTPMF